MPGNWCMRQKEPTSCCTRALIPEVRQKQTKNLFTNFLVHTHSHLFTTEVTIKNQNMVKMTNMNNLTSDKYAGFGKHNKITTYHTKIIYAITSPSGFHSFANTWIKLPTATLHHRHTTVLSTKQGDSLYIASPLHGTFFWLWARGCCVSRLRCDVKHIIMPSRDVI